MADFFDAVVLGDGEEVILEVASALRQAKEHGLGRTARLRKLASVERFGLLEERQAVLIVGGGEGHGQIYRIARRITRTVPGVQLLVVAGRNEKLRKKLEERNWEVPTRIFGFVDTMPELMGAADLLIAKAWPGTISEAFIAGMPLLLSGYIPGQESGNVRYICEHSAGAYARTSRGIARQARQWLKQEQQVLQEITRNAARLARPDAALHIAGDLCRLV